MFIKCFVCIFLLFQIQTMGQEIFLDHGVGGEGRELMKYYLGIDDQFYVDIGSYDAIFASNTLNLYTQNWGGINIDASAQRTNRFFLNRPDQTNLQFAVGQQDIFISLFEFNDDSSSTTNAKVIDLVKSRTAMMQEMKVPSLTLKQICERYYYRKPIFMNLDVEGYGGRVLEGNDWNNPLCVPQLIISEINEEVIKSGFTLPETILTKNGYIKKNYTIGLNQIYIHSSVYQTYMKREKASAQTIASWQVKSAIAISQILARYLVTTTKLVLHYEPTNNPIVHKFTKVNQVINLNKQNQWGNKLVFELAINDISRRNRPILIFHFNPITNLFLIDNGSKWEINKIMTQNTSFYNINVTQPNGEKFKVFVLDHRYKNAQELFPRILDLNNNISILDSKKLLTDHQIKFVADIYRLNQQSKELQQITQQITINLKNQIKKLESSQPSQQDHKVTKEYLDTLQKIQDRIQELENKIQAQINKIQTKMQDTKIEEHLDSSQSDKIGKKLDVLSQISTLKIIQQVTLVIMLLMCISLVVTTYLMRNAIARNRFLNFINFLVSSVRQ